MEWEGREFPTREELIDAVRQHYLARGVMLKIGRRTDRARVYLQCLASGTFEGPRLQGHQYQRETSTRLTVCPFQVSARYHKKCCVWRVKSVLEAHNHVETEGFAEFRRLNPSEKDTVRALAARGVSPSAILSHLRSEFGNNRATQKVILNEMSAARKEFLAGRSAIVALRDSLEQEQFWYNVSRRRFYNRAFFHTS